MNLKIKNSLDILNKYLIIFFPVALILGPATLNIALTILCLNEIFLILVKKHSFNLHLFKGKILILFILYLFFNALFVSNNLEVSLVTAFSFLRYIFLINAITVYFDNKINISKFFFI